MEEKKTVNGYCTKYVLTHGIERVIVGEETEHGYVVTHSFGSTGVVLQIGKTFFVKKSDAIRAARGAVKRKIAAMNKSIKKLRALADLEDWPIHAPPCKTLWEL